eukprot:scaffold7349_cov173-Amphora_coffeaeformis.AAC.6
MEVDQIDKGKENASAEASALKETLADGIPFSHNLFLPGATTITPPPRSPTTTAAGSPAVQEIRPRALKLPQSQDQFMREASLMNLLKDYKPSKLSNQRWGKGASPPLLEGPLEDTDVLFGRGNRIGGHPGNCMMRKVVALNQTFYRSASRQDKQLSADCILGYLESRGVRFVEEKSPGIWQHVAYPRVVEKIMQALREKINYRNVGLQPPSRVSKRDNKGRGKVDLAKIMLDEAGNKHRNKLLPKSSHRENNSKSKTKKTPVKVAKPVKVSSPSTTKANSPKKRARPQNPDKTPQNPWSDIRVGDRLGIYWDGDAIYYPATVEAISGPNAWILYDDQEKECLDLSRNKFFRWKECLNKRLHLPAPLNGNRQPSAPVSNTRSVSSKKSPEHSIQTQETTDTGSVYRDSSKAKEYKTISIQGSFTAPVVAPAPSLASFLRKKIESHQTPEKVTKITISAPESAVPVVAPSLASFLRKKIETPPAERATDKVTSDKSASELPVAAPSLMSFLCSKIQAPSAGTPKK